MFLNSIRAAEGTRKKSKRGGRGQGSSLGKTCGRGHKGQKSRSGGFHKVGFEGGQMPLQRRLPKIGFSSRTKKYTAEVRLSELDNVEGSVIDLKNLIDSGVIPIFSKVVKVIKSGEITRAVVLKGVLVTAGARVSIEAAGGKIEA